MGSHGGSAEGGGEEGACSHPGTGLADFPSVMASGCRQLETARWGWLGEQEAQTADRKVSAQCCGTRAPEPGPALNITPAHCFLSYCILQFSLLRGSLNEDWPSQGPPGSSKNTIVFMMKIKIVYFLSLKKQTLQGHTLDLCLLESGWFAIPPQGA